MDNLKKLVDKVHKFFGLVESHEIQIEDWVSKAKKPCHSLLNQSAILRAITPKNSIQNTAFERFEGFKEALIDNIVTALEEELNYLEEIRNKIEIANENLHKEEKFVESLYNSLKTKNLINSSELNPCSPPFEHIIDWCHDIWSYYHIFYLQISQALTKVNFEDEKSVKALSQSFTEDPDLKKHIQKIKSYNLSQFEFLI